MRGDGDEYPATVLNLRSCGRILLDDRPAGVDRRIDRVDDLKPQVRFPGHLFDIRNVNTDEIGHRVMLIVSRENVERKSPNADKHRYRAKRQNKIPRNDIP